MKNKILLSFITCLFFVSSIYAKKPPTMPISYNSTAISARVFSMAQTGAAMPGDSGSIPLNPATLGYISSDKAHNPSLLL